MERTAEHVAPVTPPGALDAQHTRISISADLQLPMNAWMPQPGLNLQENSSGIASQVSCCSGNHHYPATTGWDHSVTPRSTLPGKSGLLYLGLLPQSLVKDGSWGQKSYDQFEFYPFEPDAPVGQAHTTDDSIPIIDLRFSQPRHEVEPSYSDSSANRRSDSAIGVSACGGFSDLPTTCSSDDVSTTLSEALTFSEYDTLSNRTSLMSSAHLSPDASPRLMPQSKPDQERAQSRGRATPSPRPSMRSAPYSTDGLRDTTRWSTGSHNATQSHRHSPFGYESMPESAMTSQRYSMQASVSSSMTTGMPYNLASGPGSNIYMPPPYVPCMPMGDYRNGTAMMPPHMGHQLPTCYAMHHDNSHHSLPQPPTPASHSLLKLLQNNIESRTFHGHYADLSAPPDLYPALHEEPAPPPPEDINPPDPDLVPYEQDLRFDGDMYTTKWVRGHGNKREGWCGICKPGRWLVLKNSAYWYDKSFTHGISAATGAPFQEPLEKRRMDGNPDVWEGLCGSCNKWIALVSSKNKGTTWFRHAFKCHSHAKIKDTPKRRRDQMHNPRMPGLPYMGKPFERSNIFSNG